MTKRRLCSVLTNVDCLDACLGGRLSGRLGGGAGREGGEGGDLDGWVPRMSRGGGRPRMSCGGEGGEREGGDLDGWVLRMSRGGGRRGGGGRLRGEHDRYSRALFRGDRVTRRDAVLSRNRRKHGGEQSRSEECGRPLEA